MIDRNVQYPQRYQLVKVEGTDDIYDLIPAPGEVSAKGTLINKATLLKDATAALFGLGTDAVPDDALSAINTLIQAAQSTADGKASIVTGSYVGTGTYGASNPNTLTFDFEPKVVILWYATSTWEDEASVFLIRWNYTTQFAPGYSTNSNSSVYINYITYSGNTISWYNAGYAYYQLNNPGNTYSYLAIG